MYDFLTAPVTLYNGVADTHGRQITVGDFINRKAYDYLEGEEKKALPCITYGGRFDGRRASSLREASGVIQLDWDAKDNEFRDLEAVKRQVTFEHPESMAAISASGTGVYGLFFYWELVDTFNQRGPAAYLESHKRLTASLADHYERELGLIADRAMINRPSGLRFVSADRHPSFGEAVFETMEETNAA